MNSDDTTPSIELKSYSIVLEKHLSCRINNHIQLLKYLNHKIKSRQAWIEEAILDKLEREKNITPDETFGDEFFHFKISDHLREAIKQRVSLIKKFKSSYSQKKWFLEAFYEKLDQEESEAKRLMQNMLKVALEESAKSSN